MALSCAEMHPYQTHFSPLEAAEAGTQTVGHSPQRCRPFRVAPPMPLSVFPVRNIGELHFRSQQNSSRKQREIVHIDNATLQNHLILKKPFQNPHVCVAHLLSAFQPSRCLLRNVSANKQASGHGFQPRRKSVHIKKCFLCETSVRARL